MGEKLKQLEYSQHYRWEEKPRLLLEGIVFPQIGITSIKLKMGG